MFQVHVGKLFPRIVKFSTKLSKASDQNEWREKRLTTYLVHVLHEKFNRVILSVILQFSMLVIISSKLSYLI